MLQGMAIGCDATCVPSIQYVNPADVQSIRKSCAAPSQFPGIGVFVAEPPNAVRAYSAPPDMVLKIAQGALLRSVPRPAFWNGSPENVATNSRERPGVYRAVVLASPPSTVSSPPETVAEPPVA